MQAATLASGSQATNSYFSHAHAYIPMHAQRARRRAQRLPGGGQLRQLDHAQQAEAVGRVSEGGGAKGMETGIGASRKNKAT